MTRAIDGRENLEIDIEELALEPQDRLLLCSDGATAVLTDDEIREVLSRDSSLNDLCNALVQGANDGGGPDNVTAIVLEIHAV